MEIINSSVIKAEELSSMALESYLKKFKTTFIVYAIIIAVSIALMILFGNYIEAIIVAVLGVAVVVMNIMIKNKTLKKVTEHNREISKGVYFEYVFKDDSFQVGAVTEQLSDINEIKYETLYMVRIVADLLLLYIGANDAYVVKKSGFKNDDDWKLVIETLNKFHNCQTIK